MTTIDNHCEATARQSCPCMCYCRLGSVPRPQNVPERILFEKLACGSAVLKYLQNVDDLSGRNPCFRPVLEAGIEPLVATARALAKWCLLLVDSFYDTPISVSLWIAAMEAKKTLQALNLMSAFNPGELESFLNFLRTHNGDTPFQPQLQSDSAAD